MVAIALASLSGSSFTQSIPWIPDFIAQWADRNPSFRNFPAFGLLSAVTFLAALFSRGREANSIRLALICAASVTVLAALLEAMQLALPNRSADWRDILHAALGALTASLISTLFLKIRHL